MDKNEFEIWKPCLEKAKLKLRAAENLIQMLEPLKENRLMIKILTLLAASSNLTINSIIQKEHIKNNLKLFSSPDKNLELFFSTSSKYLKKEDKENILALTKLGKEHNKSHLEFIKKDKFVIFLGDTYEIVTLDLLKKLDCSLKILIFQAENI